jgi:hypothetical protein
LVRARLYLVVVDYRAEYEMKSMVNRDLVNSKIASLG